MGFYGWLPDCTSTEAELWGIYNGLKIILVHELPVWNQG